MKQNIKIYYKYNYVNNFNKRFLRMNHIFAHPGALTRFLVVIPTLGKFIILVGVINSA